jgi:hypothetical protein
VIGDAMDAEPMRSAILGARPEPVIQLLRVLPAGGALRADTRQMETVALRIGFLYGPDVPATRMPIKTGESRLAVRATRLDGLSPFVHIDDATSAIIAAIEKPSPSVSYNVVDDEPVALESFSGPFRMPPQNRNWDGNSATLHT